jgi:hypothetical protein
MSPTNHRDALMLRSLCLLLLTAIALASLVWLAEEALASDKPGTHREQSARHYCWKRIGLKVDDTPTEHQAAMLKPCVHKRLGYDDPYMDQF